MPKSKRLRRLLALLEAEGLDGLYVAGIPNIRYLSGFTGSSAACLVTPGDCFFFTDFRYELQARGELEGFRIVVVEAGDELKAIVARARAAGVRRLGFEAASLSYDGYCRLKRALHPSVRPIPAPSLVERCRMIKGADEIALLHKLARLTDGLLEGCRKRLRRGMTERDVAGGLECAALRAGAEEMAFRPIVASGADSAMPHCRTGKGRVGAGKPLLIDFGVRAEGYNSDLTRTFHLGRLTPRYRAVYEAVLEAQYAALQLIKPGAVAAAIDACARELIAARGFAGRFGHALGHGIGMEVHEAPRLGRDSAVTLEEGMVVTVEPGVYIPGWGGVRIEDMVLVERRGCRVLSSARKGIEDSRL